VIRYPVTQQELESRVRAEVPGWLEDAALRTERFRALGRYQEAKNAWGKVKEVFRRFQRDKCAYCERKLGAGSVEHDVDHYRPKNGVRSWPTAEIASERRIAYDFSTGGELSGGYYLLAYQLFNYAVSCKTCNTSFKSNFFPVAADRLPESLDPADLRSELPFLLYPLGDFDEDPEEILTFYGINPIPKAQEGHRRLRAVVTIDFYGLDWRDDVLSGRARIIESLFVALELREQGDPLLQSQAARVVPHFLSLSSEHASCARAFYALYENDRRQAAELFEGALRYLESQSS
jgi:hypothetical protein